jgi:heterodisulfide reductase subunit C2
MTKQTQVETLAPDAADFSAAVEKDSGANLAACLQCAKCSSGCPVAARVDIRPHVLVRLVQLGMKDEVLSCRMIWECTSCQTCITRCPQKVDIAAMNDALRRISRAEGKVVSGTTVPVFNDIFLGTIRRLGRMYEMGLMTAYKLKTMRLMDDVSKFPMMLAKGKLSIMPPRVGGGAGRKAMFDRAQRTGGKK